MLNRSALVIRYKQAFVDWINEVDDSGDGDVTLADVNEDTTLYLIEIDEDSDFDQWLELNGELIFEELLNEWYTDPQGWPQDRSAAVLRRWCGFEFHSLVIDTGSAPLVDDELES